MIVEFSIFSASSFIRAVKPSTEGKLRDNIFFSGTTIVLWEEIY